MNKLYFGDNLHVLKRHVRDETVDLVYLDPPFNSNSTYNLLYKSPVGAAVDAQLKAFKDTWRWEEDAAAYAMEEIRQADAHLFRILKALQTGLGEGDLMAYLAMMAVRIIQLRRVMKPTASLYLHCDPTASHYLKIILDAAFGASAFKNEVIWKRSSAHNSANRWGATHDVILFYTKSNKFTWHSVYQKYDQTYIDEFFTHTDAKGRRWRRTDLTGPGRRNGDSGKPWRHYDPTARGRHWQPPSYFYEKYRSLTGDDLARYDLIARLDKLDEAGLIHWPEKANGSPQGKRYLEDALGVPAQDLILDIAPLHNLARERLGYNTQKPVALMERIVAASSNPGDIVLDPFCGCGTTIHASETLRREWIGIDVAYAAVLVIQDRLATWLPAAEYDVDGIPSGEDEARALARIDPYTFQQWAVGVLGGQPRGRGADRGIDGEIAYLTGPRTYGQAIVSVKAGQNINPGMLRDLAGVVQREGADMGVFVCVNAPTKELRIEAQRSDLIELPGGMRHRLQIVTVKDLIEGPQLGILTELNSVQAALAARAEANRRPPARPTREQLRREPEFPPMPLKGGKTTRDQPTLPLEEPLLSAGAPAGRKRR